MQYMRLLLARESREYSIQITTLFHSNSLDGIALTTFRYWEETSPIQYRWMVMVSQTTGMSSASLDSWLRIGGEIGEDL